MNYLMRLFLMWFYISVNRISLVLAQTSSSADPKEMVNDYSKRMIEILQGPVSKLFGALILLIGITALLRGRHGISISCGLAFLMLLFLPILLTHVGQ